MKKVFSFMAMVTIILAIDSCKKESSVLFLDAAKANFNFLKSTPASNEANQLRSSDYSAPFEISKVLRNKDLLTVTVTYPEGCGDSTFDVIWNGLVMESYPEMIILYIRRTTNCTVLGTNTSRVLTINLTNCLGDAALAQRVIVILCNTSKKANTENSDVPVSSN
jgi:hypothetical protein